MAEKTKDYLIGTNQHASARLNLQHYWATLTCGYLLQPDIPVPGNARIADIATGTGIWPISFSLSLPPTVQLDGFDITDAQFPPKEWLPHNVRLKKLDILAPMPEELRGRYDIVAIRFFSLIVKNNDVDTLLGNLLSLLKPGGYLQWIEPDISVSKAITPRPDIKSEASEALMRDATQFLSDFRIFYEYVPYQFSLVTITDASFRSWLHALPSICKRLGMTNVKQHTPRAIEALRPIFGYGTVGAYEEFSHSILDKYGSTPSLGSGNDLRKRLDIVRGEMEHGVAFEQPLYVLVAQKPVDG
ncbi:hypothetical protein BJX63DRAFT_427961 [Aspergillus granulosus]|uniref:Methyltransferase domain-containing protein n=1 Tax=Aspergillus granulosus TaxID=176169 RepID=A0ABR4HYY1_9EURO